MTPPGNRSAAQALLLLRAVKLFEGLPAERLAAIAVQCAFKRHPRRAGIIRRDAPDQDVYFVLQGRVRATAYSRGGRQVTYRDIGAGDWFGDFAAIDGRARSADVLALEETLVAAMPAADFRRLLRTEPAVCERMLRRLTGALRELTERVFDLSTLGVHNRVHAELLRLARDAGIAGNRARLAPAPSHEDIASRISTARPEVTRALSALRRQGIVATDGRALAIADVAALERLVAEVRR